MVSVLAPLAYVVFLFSSLYIFSKVYRRRKAADQEQGERWFSRHKARDIYVSLLSLEPPPPKPVLVAALFRRAMDDVRLIWQVRDTKQSLSVLLQRGQVGDDVWERFTAAEKELEAEIVEVMQEANTFEPRYGERIFAAASDAVTHENYKLVYENIAKQRAQEAAKSEADATLAMEPYIYLTPSTLSLAAANPVSDALPEDKKANGETKDLADEAPTPAETPAQAETPSKDVSSTPAQAPAQVAAQPAAQPAAQTETSTPAPARTPPTSSKSNKKKKKGKGR